MPAIETPAGLPCPQSSNVTPEERRLLTDGDAGPLGARTIEVDERQIQTFSWMLSAAQAAVFKAWWRDTLTYGGAWFAAPATWPTPEGAVVKVRRFITAPQWAYQCNGFWRLQLTAEVRGGSELPQTSSDSLPWLYFNEGSGAEPLEMTLAGFLAISAPIAFEDGVSAMNSDGFGQNETDVVGNGLYVPLYSLNPLPSGAEYDWSPAGAGPTPELVAEQAPGSSPEWDASNYYVYFPGTSGGNFIGWPGGILTLYTDNDATGASGSTVITFLSSSFVYPPVNVEYVAP